MTIARSDVVDALAAREAEPLRAILEEARYETKGLESPRELAETIASHLWWQYCTPLGYVTARTSFDDIVNHVARKLGVEGALGQGDSWDRLHRMTALLVQLGGPVALEDLDPKHRARLSPSWLPTASYASGATGSFGALAVGKGIVFISKTSVGRVLPMLPKVGPWVRTIYRGGGIAAVVGGPAGIALSILAANNALGTNYQRLVPLLLGVGSLGPSPMTDAVVIDPDELPEGAPA